MTEWITDDLMADLFILVMFLVVLCILIVACITVIGFTVITIKEFIEDIKNMW